jgi:hypothetical protein
MGFLSEILVVVTANHECPLQVLNDLTDQATPPLSGKDTFATLSGVDE